jgi:hypothetical protein
MLPEYLLRFNEILEAFNRKYPRGNWSEQFKNNLINDYSFFSARIEDSKLQYGDTIRFLNNELVRGVNFSSLLGVAEHQEVFKKLLDSLSYSTTFKLSEDILKDLHRSLMENPLVWETEFKPELIGIHANCRGRNIGSD